MDKWDSETEEMFSSIRLEYDFPENHLRSKINEYLTPLYLSERERAEKLEKMLNYVYKHGLYLAGYPMNEGDYCLGDAPDYQPITKEWIEENVSDAPKNETEDK